MLQSDKRTTGVRKPGADGFAPSPAYDLVGDDPGQRLKRIREKLNLRYRDVEEASNQIADRHGNDEFILQLSRLADIENKGTVPSVYRLYSLCTIYRLSMTEVLAWYGVHLAAQAADVASVKIQSTHLIGFEPSENTEIEIPIHLEPGLDPKRTTYISQMIQQWGRLPLTLLGNVDVKRNRYAFVGSDDWSMYPLIQPGSLVLIDETQRRIVNAGWNNEFERPIYFLEHVNGFACVWCTSTDDQIVLQPHPASMCSPEVYKFPEEISVIGQVCGLAMRLDQARRRQVRA